MPHSAIIVLGPSKKIHGRTGMPAVDGLAKSHASLCISAAIMKVHIKYAGTKQTIEVEGDTKLGELRTRAAALTGADASALRYLGKNLEDDAKTLTDCGIKNNRTVTCCAQFTMDEVLPSV